MKWLAPATLYFNFFYRYVIPTGFVFLDCFAALAMTDVVVIADANHRQQTIVVARSVATKQSILRRLSLRDLSVASGIFNFQFSIHFNAQFHKIFLVK
jgi:hypothetical protein